MKSRRKRKLVRPDLPVRGILFALGLALGTVVVQAITMTFVLHRVATKAPNDGPAILQELPGLSTWSAIATFVLLAPMVLALTLNATHRFAGPIFRIEQYLKAVVDGRDPGELKLRSGDKLQDVAELVAEAIEGTAEREDEAAPVRGPRALPDRKIS